jgi:hypothetical protein
VVRRPEDHERHQRDVQGKSDPQPEDLGEGEADQRDPGRPGQMQRRHRGVLVDADRAAVRRTEPCSGHQVEERVAGHQSWRRHREHRVHREPDRTHEQQGVARRTVEVRAEEIAHDEEPDCDGRVQVLVVVDRHVREEMLRRQPVVERRLDLEVKGAFDGEDRASVVDGSFATDVGEATDAVVHDQEAYDDCELSYQQWPRTAAGHGRREHLRTLPEPV